MGGNSRRSNPRKLVRSGDKSPTGSSDDESPKVRNKREIVQDNRRTVIPLKKARQEVQERSSDEDSDKNVFTRMGVNMELSEEAKNKLMALLDDSDSGESQESDYESEDEHFRTHELPLDTIYEILLEQGKSDVTLAAVDAMVKDRKEAASRQDLANKAVEYQAKLGKGDESPTVRQLYAKKTDNLLADIKQDPEPTSDKELISYLTSKKAVNVGQGQVKASRNKAIGTFGMGPCIALGKTGTFNGDRYSALTHWDGVGPEREPSALFDSLDRSISDLDSSLKPGVLKDVRYIVVGGRLESANNQVKLLQEIRQRGLAASIHLVTPDYGAKPNQTGANAKNAESAALIDEDGAFRYHVTTELPDTWRK